MTTVSDEGGREGKRKGGRERGREGKRKGGRTVWREGKNFIFLFSMTERVKSTSNSP